MSSFSRCAACKYLRRKCPQDCILAPYFPSSNPQRFACVHKIFGASNVTKMLQQVPVHLRAEAAECISYEAIARVQDPVYGCVGIITQLQQQIIQIHSEIMKIKGDIITHHSAHPQHQPLPPPQGDPCRSISIHQQEQDNFQSDEHPFGNF
ncbi:LOB domain-containing protein 24-like isoform X2 [Rhodamnia argentea]|nr:LOB domain-containing protein 24-like isoform X2 [Rhodamnia argentea]